MVVSRFALVGVFFFVASVAIAQSTPERQKGQKDAQAAVEPRSAPGAGQKFLAKFVGDWEVAKAFYPTSGEPARASGECRQSMTHGGRFLKSEFVFHQRGGETTGTGVIGFEPDTGLFTSFWVDSRSTRMSVRRSQQRFDGKEIVLHAKSLDEESKGSRRSRTVTRLEKDGKQIVHRQYSLGADGKERLMMELVMTRKPAAAPASR